MANTTTSSSCPAPFFALTDVAGTGGYVAGRFCGDITPGLECCLPCPSTDWIYSKHFNRNLDIAYWFNVPALVLQLWLLITFLVLPAEVSHGHYLSVGLVLSLIMCELAFIVPLGAQPNECYDAITPRDMYSSMSCAWSGALIVTGAMGAIVWVLLRSLWTHLRVVWDFHETALIFWLSQIIGWGLPGLFLALTIPITGVSYRIGHTCLPNQKNALVTWIGWLIAFACAAALIQFITTGYCLLLYIRQMMRGDASDSSRNSNLTYMSRNTPIASPTSVQPPSLAKLDRRNAWRRVRRVMKLQWRSIALTILGIIETVYFVAVFVNENSKSLATLTETQKAKMLQWVVCYLRNGQDRFQCEKIADIVGLNEEVIEAAFYIIAIVGICTFLLMGRRSMFIGWANLLRHPFSLGRRDSLSDEDFVIMSPTSVSGSPKRKSFGRPLESEKDLRLATKGPDVSTMPRSPVSPMSPMSFVLPEPTPTTEKSFVVPQAGDVTKRHETTNLFEGEEDEGQVMRDGRPERKRVSGVNEDDLA